jgi:Uncharacterized MobA-related protein
LKYGSVGAVIAAASKKDAAPLLQIGSIPIVSRIVLTLQQADVFPIVIVTGTQEVEVIHQLAKFGTIFLRNEDCEQPELFSSVKKGLSYLQGKCDRVIFTPVNTPMFKPETLRAILESNAEIAVPSCHGRGGHPILLQNQVIDDILHYQGGDGLRGAVASLAEKRVWVDVEDDGILSSTHNQTELRRQVAAHNNSILRPNIKVGIEKENIFFDARLKLLMFLIEDLGSIRQACDHMGLSYQKAWDMVNQLEQEIGYSVVERRHGGSRGRRTMLTERGRQLMHAYQRFEREIRTYARQSFEEIFQKNGLI